MPCMCRGRHRVHRSQAACGGHAACTGGRQHRHVFAYQHTAWHAQGQWHFVVAHRKTRPVVRCARRCGCATTGDAGLPPDRAPAPNAFRLRCALKLPPVPMIQWVGALTFFEPQCIMRPQERLCVSCFGALSAPWRLGIHSFTKLFTCETFVRRTSAYRASAVSYHTIRPAALRCRHTRRTRIERTCARPCPCPARRCGAPYRHT